MIKKIQNEIDTYKNQSYTMLDGYSFSAYKLLRRIGLYKAQVYPNGKFDSQDNYKYWFEIIRPRVDSEIKNIDFDTKDIELYTDTNGDYVRLLLSNVAMKDYLAKSGEADKLNEAVEQGSEWGNVVWKEVGKNYRILELNNFMVLNQTAKTLDESDVIEYEMMISSDLRKKKGVWNNDAIDRLLKSGKPELNKSNPEFHIYERNGEVSEKEYYTAKKIEKDGKFNTYKIDEIIEKILSAETGDLMVNDWLSNKLDLLEKAVEDNKRDELSTIAKELRNNLPKNSGFHDFIDIMTAGLIK